LVNLHRVTIKVVATLFCEIFGTFLIYCLMYVSHGKLVHMKISALSFTSAAVSSIDRYASIGGLSNQSDSMATQVGSAVDDRKLASIMSAQHEMAVKRGSSVSSGR